MDKLCRLLDLDVRARAVRRTGTQAAVADRRSDRLVDLEHERLDASACVGAVAVRHSLRVAAPAPVVGAHAQFQHHGVALGIIVLEPGHHAHLPDGGRASVVPRVPRRLTNKRIKPAHTR